MDETNLRNLSPLDGRYRDKTKESREIFSEESLINKRLTVELKWLKFFIKNFRKDLVKKETWDRKRALEFYKEKNEPYKVELIQDIPVNEDIKMYWHGDWQDLCRGPHLVHTGQVPADSFKLTRVAGAYWKGNSKNKMLQRINGEAF